METKSYKKDCTSCCSVFLLQLVVKKTTILQKQHLTSTASATLHDSTFTAVNTYTEPLSDYTRTGNVYIRRTKWRF